MLSAVEAAELELKQVRVRPAETQMTALLEKDVSERALALADHPRGHAQRMGDIKRSGTMTLEELVKLDLSVTGSSLGTAKNGNYVHSELELDESFWRVVGLYLAEGNCYRDETAGERLSWSFHPSREQHLVDEIVAYWQRQGVRVSTYRKATAHVAGPVAADRQLVDQRARSRPHQLRAAPARPDLGAVRRPASVRSCQASGRGMGLGHW